MTSVPRQRRGRVVVMDYPGRRDEGRVTDLALTDAGFDVVDVLAMGEPPVTDPDDYPRVLLERAGSPADTTAVLGYCLAAPLALSLAQAMNIRLVLLFEAHDVTADVIADEFTAIRSAGSEPSPWSAPELAMGTTVLSRMRGTLATDLGAAMGDDGDDLAEAGAEVLLTAYMEWLTFLVAGHRAGLAEPLCPGAVNIVSGERVAGHPWNRGPVETVRFDCDRRSLLHQASTRDFVIDRLTTRSESMSASGGSR